MEKQIRELFNTHILSEAASFYGVSQENIKEVGGFENFIYEFEKNNEPFILRISHSSHRTIQLIESEIDFVNFLANHQANVSTPIKSNNDKYVEVVSCEDGSYFTLTAYTKAKGSHPRRNTTTDLFFENYGKTIGQFHQLTTNYQKPSTIERRFEWYDDLLITEAKTYLPESEQPIYLKLMELVEFIKTLPQNQANYGLIHTDIHMGNLFVENNELTVFDFDDCAYQYFISDIAIALFYFVAFNPDEEARYNLADYFMKLFMKGYLKEHDLDIDSYHQIPHFLKLRELIIYVVIYRSCDLEKDEWARDYINMYRDRILNDVPFLNIDFSNYYKINK